MPVIYGHPQEPALNSSHDLNQYTKWFELMGMDFELLHIGHSWICNAWSREKNTVLVSGSGTKETVSEALHACYSDIRSLAK